MEAFILSILPDNCNVYQETASGVQIIRYSAPSVEQNLAVDEKFAREAGIIGTKALRLWWGGPTAVVLGCSDKPECAINTKICEMLNIPVLKRVTGGGAVLQSPGVLNYSLTMPDTGRLDIHRIFSLGASLIINALSILDVKAQHEGISDIAVGDLKISGNAQARKWKSVLLHGTILVEMDYDLLETILKHPNREPDYRKGRSHRDFIITLHDLGIDTAFYEIENAVVNAAIDVL
ncbi:MAG: lipoate--protein ligase family protein [Armatimonadota bacterium]